MGASEDVTRVRPADRKQADPTPGKVREQAIDVDGMWSGLVHSEPGSFSGSTSAQEIVTRSGTGPVTINVDGPAVTTPGR